MANNRRPPTDYAHFALSVLARMPESAIDQPLLQHSLALAPSYLITDTSMDPSKGPNTWLTGFNRLIDVVLTLDARNDLELDTLNAASKACSECWSIAGCWRGLEDGREGVRKIAGRLKTILDPETGRTYRGQNVWAP